MTNSKRRMLFPLCLLIGVINLRFDILIWQLPKEVYDNWDTCQESQGITNQLRDFYPCHT